MNRLASETSPYLLQHKDNPVDWYPWGPEAFAKAASEDKPIFLSVGYSSCHWCHVMEHESFVDSEVAALLNEHFVSIKVDREERPDVDEAYMTAVQLGSGRGGWPMSVFLTPDRRPFFAATYLPKQDHPQSPGFITALTQIERVWREERPKVEEIAAQYDEAIRASLTRESPQVEVSLDQELLDEVVKKLSMDFDEENGGFGQAPKFPPHTAIGFLLAYASESDGTDELRQTAADMAFFTLEKMALGGIRDHVGGGFHRYSTDGHWLLPHFEKMLYDNAMLLGNYALATSLLSGSPVDGLFSKVVDEIVAWVKREMMTAEGLFCSALDADSEGEEGKYYVWSAQEVSEVLGERSRAFMEAFQIRADGNFRDEATGAVTGHNIPHLLEDIGDRFDEDLSRLRAEREKRVKPGLDYKILVSWNGLMIGALAEAGELEAAERAAQAILRYEKEGGGLPHQIASGKPSGDGFLEDYAYFIDGLFRLEAAMASFEEIIGMPIAPGDFLWGEEAKRLTRVMVEKFYDEERGGFFSTSTNHEDLFGRTKPVFDQPLPSPNALAIKALFVIEDETRVRQSLNAFLGWMARAPAATEALHQVALEYLTRFTPGMDGVEEVVSANVKVSLSSESLTSIDGKAPGSVILEIPEGHYVTSVKVETDAPFTMEYFCPPGRLEGLVEIPFRVLNERGDVRLSVTFQTCTETECRPEETHPLYAKLRPI